MLICGQEESLSVKEYVKTLLPIEDFGVLMEGQKMFNKQSLDVSYVDTFVSYDKERDIVTYRNYKGELWRGYGKGYWYFIN